MDKAENGVNAGNARERRQRCQRREREALSTLGRARLPNGLGAERRGQSDLRNRVAGPLVAPSCGLPLCPTSARS